MRKRILLLWLLNLVVISVMMLFAGCSRQNEDGWISVDVAYMSSAPETNKDGIFYFEKIDIEKDMPKEEAVKYLISAMQAPSATVYTSAIPVDTYVESVKINGNSITVDMSSSYSKIPDIQQTVSDAAITMTLCNIPDIELVRITCGGVPKSNRPDRYFTAASFIMNGESFESIKYEITLYFPNKAHTALIPETRETSIDDGKALAEMIMNELIRGPQNELSTYVTDRGVRVLYISIDDKVCSLNLSDAFLKNIEDMSIYAIGNSLCSLPEIDEVEILVEGKNFQEIYDSGNHEKITFKEEYVIE